MNRRSRVHAYITHRGRLLVFEHTRSEAGIQVPAGTVKEHESTHAAVMREALEETGLGGLELVTVLGHFEHDMIEFGVDELQHAWFYHLRCTGDPPERWRHDETGGGTSDPIRFEFYWVSFPEQVPELIALNGSMLDRLYDSLGVEA